MGWIPDLPFKGPMRWNCTDTLNVAHGAANLPVVVEVWLVSNVLGKCNWFSVGSLDNVSEMMIIYLLREMKYSCFKIVTKFIDFACRSTAKFCKAYHDKDVPYWPLSTRPFLTDIFLPDDSVRLFSLEFFFKLGTYILWSNIWIIMSNKWIQPLRVVQIWANKILSSTTITQIWAKVACGLMRLLSFFFLSMQRLLSLMRLLSVEVAQWVGRWIADRCWAQDRQVGPHSVHRAKGKGCLKQLSSHTFHSAEGSGNCTWGLMRSCPLKRSLGQIQFTLT